MRKIERLQGRALRIIYCDRTSTYEALLDKSRLPTLRNRRLQNIAILMYQVRTNLVLSYITDLFTCNMSIGIRCDTVTVIVPVTATVTVTITVADTDSGFSTEIKVAWIALANEILQYLTCAHSFFDNFKF